VTNVKRKTFALTIPAKIYSNDRAMSAQFDAAEWFATAPKDRILDLASHDWSGHTAAADDLARSAATTNDAIADVFQYVMYQRHGGMQSGWQCSVDPVSALEWLANRRPAVLAMVRMLKRPVTSTAS
jgi:hypothetical protein